MSDMMNKNNENLICVIRRDDCTAAWAKVGQWKTWDGDKYHPTVCDQVITKWM